MDVSMGFMRLPDEAPQLKITPKYWKFKREALSWMQLKERPEEGPWASRVLVVEVPSLFDALQPVPYAAERIGIEEIRSMKRPLFEKVNDLFDFYPVTGKTADFEEKCLEFTATHGALFYRDSKTTFESKKQSTVINLGALNEWTHFVMRIRRVMEHITEPPASEGRRFVRTLINELLKDYPTGFFLTGRMETTQGEVLDPILERAWSPSLASLVVLQLAEIFAVEPDFIRCSLCGHYGPREVMTKVEDNPGSFLTREDRIREGLPPDGDLWLHNRDKALNEKRKKAGPMDAPACYSNLHKRVKRYWAKQNKTPNNQPVSPEK